MVTCQIEFEKRYSQFTTTVYLSHPWEDNSGLYWRNWPDNLIGFHVHINREKPVILDVVYEYINTRQQSIRDSLDKEPDGYYNHGVYGTGFTYRQRPMSSPLFFPEKMVDGVSAGIQSNRYFAHHLGMQGFLNEQL